MFIYRDGRTKDVQPKVVHRYEADGWSRTPPTSRPSGWDHEPDETSGDVSTEQGER